MREIVEKSYRQTAKTISQDTGITISHSATRNIVLKMGEKIKGIEKEKQRFYERGEIEGEKEKEVIFCEHDGIYLYLQDRKNNKEKRKERLKTEVKIGIIHEGTQKRYHKDKRLVNKQIVATIGTAKEYKKLLDIQIGMTYKEDKLKRIIINGDGSGWTHTIVEGAKEIFQLDMAHIQKRIYEAVEDTEYLNLMRSIVYTDKPEQIFNIIYNYKVELEYEQKEKELDNVKELEEYLRNNAEGILRYQYKLGYKEEQITNELIQKYPTLGTEESQMYCCCRKRMKRNRCSWSKKGAEAMLKVISYVKSNILEDIITGKMQQEIEEELEQRIVEPRKIKKIKQGYIRYAGTAKIQSNIGKTYSKMYIKELLRVKPFSEMTIVG